MLSSANYLILSPKDKNHITIFHYNELYDLDRVNLSNLPFSLLLRPFLTLRP